MAGIKKKVDLYCGRSFKIGPTVFSGNFTGIILDEEAIRIALSNKAQVKEVLRNGKRAPLDFSNYYKRNPMGYDVDHQFTEGDPRSLNNIVRTVRPNNSGIRANQPPVFTQVGNAPPATSTDIDKANDYSNTIITPHAEIRSNPAKVDSNGVANILSANALIEKKTESVAKDSTIVIPTDTSFGAPAMIKSEPREYTTNTGVLETVKRPEPNVIKAINTTSTTESDNSQKNKHELYKKQQQQKPNTIQAINNNEDSKKDKSTDNNEKKSEEKK